MRLWLCAVATTGGLGLPVGLRSAALMAALLGGTTTEAAGQRPAAPGAQLSADTVELGTTFELRVSVDIPPGSTVYFPDTLPTTSALESHGAARWSADARGDGAHLTVTYPLMAFAVGTVPVPGLEILLARRVDAPDESLMPGGSSVGTWARAPSGRGTELTRLRIPPHTAWVRPVLTVEATREGGLRPKPASDVVGSSWSPPALALLALFSSVLIGVAGTAGHDWLSARRERSGSMPDSRMGPEEAKAAALRELEDLFASPLLASGRVRDFYAESSAIVRRYAHHLDPAWGPSLTGTELVHELVGAGPPGDDAGAFGRTMRDAEVVKFGRTLPTPPEAERHWKTLHAWLDGSEGSAR